MHYSQFFILFSEKCSDGTTGTPYCGKGPCNMFGCNCDGGCRKAGRMGAISDGIGHIDSNGDGKVSLDEATAIVDSEKVPFAREEFARMDLNLDGFLSREEIDPQTKS